MVDLETQLHDLHLKIEDTAGRKAAASIELSKAEDGLTAALAALREEFGVATVEDATILLDKLKEEAAAEVRVIEAALAVAEGK
jgi:hypothetical protein